MFSCFLFVFMGHVFPAVLHVCLAVELTSDHEHCEVMLDWFPKEQQDCSPRPIPCPRKRCATVSASLYFPNLV